MFRLPYGSCTTGSLILLLAAAPSAAGPGGGGGSWFGLPHAPLGDATLGAAPDGRLAVSNIGSSGLDGVEITLGQTTGFGLQVDPGPGGALAPGAMTCVRGNGGGSNSAHASICEDGTGTGAARIALDAITGFSPQCVQVDLRLRGNPTDICSIYDPGALPTTLVTGPFGSDALGNPMAVEIVTTATSLTFEIFNPEEIMASIPGSPTGPVLCDTVVITLDGLPPGAYYLSSVGVTGSNMPNGELMVGTEALRIRPKGWDGTVKGNLRALGDGQMAGIAGPPLCAGCPECCDPPGGDPLDLFSAASVSNLGSSGLDGVAYECRPWGSPWFVSDLMLRTSPIEIPCAIPGASLALHATGTFGGVPDQDLGTCSLRSNPATAVIELLADFSPVGSSDLTVEVRNNGVAQGSVVLTGGPGAVLGTLTSATGLPYRWTKCGKLGGTPVDPPCYALCADDLFAFDDGSGVALVGNELRVLATGATGPIEVLGALQVRAAQLDPFIVTPIQDPDIANDPVMFGGLPHTAFGLASLAVADVDMDGRADLVVSNIGSSGKDGVSIDLGAAQGARLWGGDDWFVDSFFDIGFDIYDDQCPTCPQGLVAGLGFEPLGGGQTTFRKTHHELSGHVLLMKSNGVPAGEFDSDDTEELLITTGAGAGLVVTELLAQALRTGATPTPTTRIALRCSLGQSPPDPGSPGVTVTHPTLGSFTEVVEIIVTAEDATGSVGSVDRACLRATASPACDPCTLTVAETSLVKHGLVHTSVNDARLVAEDCDDEDSDDDGILWVTSCCLGSTGKDGVCVDLTKFTCSGRDNDCDGQADDDVAGIHLGFSVEIDHSGSRSMTVGGTVDGGPEQGLALLTTEDGAPGERHVLADAPAFGATPVTVTVTVRDQFGNVVLDGSPPTPGPAAIVDEGTPIGSYQGEFQFTVIPSFAGGTTGVSAAVQTIAWPTDVQVRLPGGSPVAGRSLEVSIGPAGGAPAAIALEVRSVEVLANPDPGAAASTFGLVTEEVLLVPSFCPGDLDGNGSVGFADLNVVLSGWGPCPPAPAACAGDLDANGSVGFADLNVVLAAWGACP